MPIYSIKRIRQKAGEGQGARGYGHEGKSGEMIYESDRLSPDLRTAKPVAASHND